MAFDAGDIEATAQIDTEPFQLALVRLDQSGRDFANKKYTPTVTADTKKATEDLDKVETKLKIIGAADARAHIQVDGADHVNEQLDDIEAKLLSIKGISATIGGSGGSSGRGGGGSSSSFLSKLGGHAPSFAALGIGAAVPTIGPLLGLGAGAAASAITPISAATIGIGAFGLAAHSSIKTLSADMKTLTKDQAAYNAATSDKTRAAAQAKELKFWQGLSPAQQGAITNLHGLSKAWTGYQKALQPEIFPLLASGLKIATTGLGYLLPVATATGKELNSLATSAESAFQSPFWHNFFTQFLPGQATKATHAFAVSLGNLVDGGVHLVEAFAPLGGGFESSLEHLTKRFDDWSTGKGPAKFVKWVHSNAPQIKHDVEQMASGVVKVVDALIPVGETVLKDVGAVASAIGKFSSDHPGDIEKIGKALLIVGGSLKVIAGADKAITVLSAVNRLTGGGGLAGGGGGTGGGGGAAAGGLGGLLSRIVTNPKGAIASGDVAAAGSLAVIPVATWLAGQGIDSKTGKGIYSNQAEDYRTRFPVQAALTSTVFQPTLAKYSATPAAAKALLGNSDGSAYSTTGLVSAIEKTGTAKELANLKNLAKAYPEVARAMAPYEAAQGQLNKQLGIIGPLSQSAIGKAQHLAGVLLAQGEPLDEVRGKVQAYVRSLLGIPKSVHTTVTANTAAAIRALDILHSKELSVAQGRYVSPTLPSGGHLTPVHSAAGGPIYGAGTARSDSIPAMLSNGEFVVNAASTAHNRTLLMSINAEHFAAGGQAGLPPWLTSQGSVSANAPTSTSTSSTTGSGRRRAAGAAGPSKLTIANAVASLAQYAGLTFVTDLQGTATQIRSGVTHMIDRLNNAVRDHYLSSDKQLVASIKHATPTLLALASREVATAKALGNAQNSLANLRSDASGVRSSTLSAYQGLGDLSQASSTTTVAGLVSVLGQQRKVGGAFSRNLATLRKRGLSKTAYSQLLAAGPSGAGSIVALLATASKAQLGQINNDESYFTGLGTTTGGASATFLYQKQINAQTALVKQMSTNLHDEQRAEKRLATAMENLVKAGVHDKGTHARQDQTNALLVQANRLLAELAGAPGHAKKNTRSHVAGVNR